MSFPYWMMPRGMSDLEQRYNRVGQSMDTFGSVMGLSENDKAKAEYFMQNIPYVGDILKFKDDWNTMNRYLDSHNMEWSDVKHPIGGTSLRGTVATLSRNVLTLYR